MGKERRGLLAFDASTLIEPELPAAAPAAAEASPRRAGAVRDIASSIQHLENEASEKERLEQMLRNGETIVSLDASLCDPSPIRDRLDTDFSDLIPAIRDQGQKVPILVRPHPEDGARYQIAFGNRRAQVCFELGIEVKAVVREMTDEEMVVAQGQENTARRDLSYIEMARFAAKLKQHFETTTVAAAISADTTAIYKMRKIVERIPEELIVAIGPAPKIGRPRWEKLSTLLEGPEQVRKSLTAAQAAAARGRQSDSRFEAALEALTTRAPAAETEIKTEAGRTIASRRSSQRGDSLVIKETAFLEHLLGDLPRLYEQYLDAITRKDQPPAQEVRQAA